MSLPSDTPQGIANALGYLQHHLQELTERQHVSENNINSTLVALTTQLQQLTQLVANPPPLAVPNTPPLPVPSPPVSPPPALPVRWTRPKLSCPPDFNGERHNGRAFLNSCSLYIRLAPEQFHDEQERILWALTFFKGDCAAKWSENIFRQEADTGVFPIQIWGDFEQQFQLHFFPTNAEVDTINALEGTSYHQGNQTVDDYLDSFQALVFDVGYADPQTLVVKFQQGLRLGIQNYIATMPYRRPADTDPDAWYRAARRIDQACLTNEAFQSVSCSAPSASLKTVSARPPPLSAARLPLAPSPPVIPKPLPTAPSMGVPMDVDAARKTRSLPPRGCYRCGDANHVVQDCPHCMDVCQLTTEQREELIEDLLALKDAVLMEESCPPEEEDFA